MRRLGLRCFDRDILEDASQQDQMCGRWYNLKLLNTTPRRYYETHTVWPDYTDKYIPHCSLSLRPFVAPFTLRSRRG